ncbi:MAG: cyclic nucleotide-binding domain-containing protein [Hyphomicrobiales bacterium]|nr:cyclic nucleotide-binding domain-containing protein [Hyphomicrobiales bacterium]MCP5373102.1 cyclic nucleotide-binding domain-containing protein [Hyphomicrobiales bacterium]
MQEQSFAAGAVLFREGDAGDSAFLVRHGAVEISRDVDGQVVVLGEIGPGGLFGEMALISAAPRMATATARADTSCVVVPPDVFAAELDGADAFMRALVLSLIGHVRSLSAKLQAGPGALPDAPPDAPNSGVELFQPDGRGGYRQGT